jgi:riboflavin synthase
MFTGIVEEIGYVRGIRKNTVSCELTLEGNVIFSDLKIGDSVAVNGVCLTATRINGHTFCADVMHETMNRTSFAQLKSGSPVNLERAMAADGRFGGHIVSGHIDGTGKIVEVKKDDNAIWYFIETKPQILHYIIEKGSITIDGISLTVADVSQTSFGVSIIPHTAANTILAYKGCGDIVNLENDVIGKYVEKLIAGTGAQPETKSRITENFLMENGFIR